MQTTTFLLDTAIATSAVLGALLFVRKPGDEPVRIRLGAGSAVAGVAIALTAIGLWLL